MLKPIPSARLLRALRASLGERELACSFCRPPKARFAGQTRNSTRIASTTSVNAQKEVPVEYKELYDQLNALGKAAAVYTNTSQLQLALKNLEVKDPVTRIAVLGVNNQLGPLQLVRSLLADPLSPEAPWEKELQRASQDGKPLLIRPGYKISIESSHPLLRTLTIPSKLLESSKIELLIHRVVLEDQKPIEPTEEVLSALLSPSLHAQQSFSGRTTSVTYPVHKTILLEDGFGSLLSLAGLLQSREGRTASGMIQIVTNVSWSAVPEEQSRIFFVNLTKGLHAIEALRKSIQNSSTYEHEWLSSGLPALLPILLPQKSEGVPIKPMVRDLIKHIIDETELGVSLSETAYLQRISDRTISDKIRQNLRNDLAYWAERAHIEFRQGIANITHSRAWRKLAWWKLLWRVDDVNMITSEAIRRTYLIEAEKDMMFLAGGIDQAGLLRQSRSKDALLSGTSAIDIETGPVETEVDAEILEEARQDEPQQMISSTEIIPLWPEQIASSRGIILHETIPPLVASAQRYLLSALSLTSLTSLTSVLAYFSVTTTSLYEAGTVAAVGLVFGAYRLQSKWENARRAWITGVEIEGKRTLDEVEKRCREVIDTGGHSPVDEIGLVEREKAKAAIRDVRESLAKLEQSSPDRAVSDR